MRSIRTVLLALTAVTLCQCASGPSSSVRIGTESKVAVYYEQPRQGLRQAILGDKLVDPREFYSDSRSDKYAKVATNQQLQVLIDGLAECGFFHVAGTQPDSGAASTISVEIDGVVHCWSLSGMTPQQQLGDYTQALAWFQNVYNSIDAFHTAGEQTDMAAEHARLQRLIDERTGVRKERP
ncbi:MAG: hypothetical protein U1F36_01450 [Planctomycetota bacterium]